jgi:hypothetical protein
MDWLYNLWNSLDKLEHLQKYLRFAPVLGTLIGTLLLVWVGFRIDYLKSARDKAEKESLARGIESLNPYRQPINAVTATVQIIVASNQKAAGRQIGPGFSLKFVIGGEEVLEGSSVEYVAIPLTDGFVRYSSEFSVDVRKSARGISVSSLQATESIKLLFYGMPDNTAIHLGLLECLINGSIPLKFRLGNQRAEGKEIPVQDIQKSLQEGLQALKH